MTFFFHPSDHVTDLSPLPLLPTQQDRTFVFNLRKSRKNNQTPKQQRHLQSVSIIKDRILFNIIKNEGKRVKHARELGQSLLRKRTHARPLAKTFIRQLSGDKIRAQLTKRLVTKPRLAEAAARIAKAKQASK